MQAVEVGSQPDGDVSRQESIAAFRDVHGRHLHGFALLLTLGDRRAAGSLAAGALADAALQLDELRHPERAAAWLRANVVRQARHGRFAPSSTGMAALEALDVPRPAAQALSQLGLVERAALITTVMERLDRRDVAAVVGRDGDRLERLLVNARRRYASAYETAGGTKIDGPLTRRIQAVADRAMA